MPLQIFSAGSGIHPLRHYENLHGPYASRGLPAFLAGSDSTPIAVPPGVAGMQPSLALDYSSRGGNGTVGVGFSLSGLSSITRCPKTIAQDGERGRVRFDADDRFCLDGQRLMAINGTYGASGTEYRTELDGASRIVSYGQAGSGPERFKVWTKSGQIIEYGFTYGSRVDAAIFPDATINVALGTVRQWSVNRITDTVGNAMTVSYSYDQYTGKHYPVWISYDGGHVALRYQSRNDVRSVYQMGSPIKYSARLSAIETYTGDQLASRYQLDYDESPSWRQSRLIRITQYDVDGNALPPTEFDWETGPNGYSDPVKLLSASFGGYEDTAPSKEDKDGNQLATLIDINGDGLLDRVEDKANGSYGIWVALATGDGFAPLEDWSFSTPKHEQYRPTWVDKNTIYSTFLDINGDGLPDRVNHYNYATNQPGIWVALNTGDGLAPLTRWSLGTSKNEQYYPQWGNGTMVYSQFLDVNNDGLPDRVNHYNYATGRYGMWVALNTGQGFEPLENWGTTARNEQHFPVWQDGRSILSGFIDINNDNLPDRVHHYNYQSSQYGIWVSLNTGSSFGPLRNWWEHSIPKPEQMRFRWGDDQGTLSQFLDVDGDRLPDRVHHFNYGNGKNGFWWSRNTGRSFEVLRSLATPEHQDLQISKTEQYRPTWTSSQGATYAQFLDINADGLPDRVYHHNYATNSEGFWVSLNLGRKILSIGAWGPVRFGPLTRWEGTLSRVDQYLPRWSDETNTYSIFSDVNGDGQVDRLNNHNYETNQYGLWVSYNQSRPSELVGIRTGLGEETRISYASLTGPGSVDGVYDSEVELRDGEVALLSPMRVVTATETTNGVGTYNRTSYRYGGGKIDRNGRGLLGFAWDEVTDETTGRTTVTQYRQDFPYIGTPWRVATYLADGQLVSDSEVNLAHRDNGHGVVMPYAATKTEHSYELGEKLVSTSVTEQSDWDAYGNVGRVVVRTTAGGETLAKTTLSDYDNTFESNRWFLGRLRSAQVTHEAPGTPPLTRHSAFTYYADTGLLRQEIIEPGNTARGIQQTTTYEYDDRGNETRVTVTGMDSDGQPRSRTTETRYTADGRFVHQVINALGHTETHQYDPRFGELIRLDGPNGLTTTWTFDGFGRKLSEDRADGTSTLWTREWVFEGDQDAPAHAVYKLTEQQTADNDNLALPPVTTYQDLQGRTLRKVSTGFDGTLVYQDSLFDERGREQASTLPYFVGDQVYWVETTYDALDRVIRKSAETERQLVITSYAYDGLKIVETDPLGNQKTTWKGANGKVAEVQQEEGAYLEYSYDAAGNLLRTVQGDDNAGKAAVTEITYNTRGQKIRMDDADMGVWTYGHSAFGELEWQQDAVGNRTEMHMDELGRMVERADIAADGTIKTTTWYYDSAPGSQSATGTWIGRLHRVTGPESGYSREVEFDQYGREAAATVETDGKSFNIVNTFDDFGRVVTTTRPGGLVLENVYNEFGFLIEKRSPVGRTVDGYDPEHLNSLLDQTVASADAALARASEYAQKAAEYRAKADEYETVLDALIADQQLAGDAPDLGDAAFALLRDTSGNEYLKTPPEVLMLHGDILTPIVYAPEQVYRLVRDGGGHPWSLQIVDAGTWAGIAPTATPTGESLYFGDFNRDGTFDFLRVANADAAVGGTLTQCNDDPAVADAHETNEFAPDLIPSGADLEGQQAALLVDSRGTEYFRVPKGIAIIHGPVATPVVFSPEQYYRLVFDRGQGRWGLEAIDAERWADTVAPEVTPSGNHITFADSNNDGTLDFQRLDSQGQAQQLAASTRECEVQIASQGPLIDRSLFDNLLDTASEIRSAADMLQRQAESAVAVAQDLIVVAADLNDRARQAELWANASDTNSLAAITYTDGTITFWRAEDRDASGRLTAERAGNGLVTIRDFDPANGHLHAIQSGFQYGMLLRDLEYEYDAADNVLARYDHVQEAEERFEYDRLQRLTRAEVSGYAHGIAYDSAKDYRYDALGNITFKSDIGAYLYGDESRAQDNAGPHALTTAGNKGRYRYDANGSIIEGGGRTIEWSSFNKPVRLTKGTTSVGFVYGPDRARVKKTVHKGGAPTETTFYLGKAYERIEKAGSVTHKYFVTADDGITAIYVRHERNGAIDTGADQVRYLHRDALGSVDTITDARGVAIQRTSFEPFGARRGGDWTSSIAGIELFTNRGFTGHEHIEEIGLIHMNGRVYDPELGRFLSADPHVQEAANSQSYNRYSYALNNPLKYTDPSGYFFKSLFKAIGKLFSKVLKLSYNVFWKPVFNFLAENQIAYAIAMVALNMIPGIGTVASIALSAALAGGVAYEATGSFSLALKTALITAGTAAAFYGVGHELGLAQDPAFLNSDHVQKVVLHGAVGGLSSSAQGGDFLDGFTAAATTQLFAPAITNHLKTKPARAFAGAVVGGTSSKLGGGKFSNGAITGAFSRMYNDDWNKTKEYAQDVSADIVTDAVESKNSYIGAAIRKVRALFGIAESVQNVADQNGTVAKIDQTVKEVAGKTLQTIKRSGDLASKLAKNLQSDLNKSIGQKIQFRNDPSNLDELEKNAVLKF